MIWFVSMVATAGSAQWVKNPASCDLDLIPGPGTSCAAGAAKRGKKERRNKDH